MPTTSSLVTCAATMLLLGTGAVIDIRTRRIPNLVTVATTLVGLALAASGLSGVTLTQSVAGFVVGGLLMMPGYLLRATGAGDVKALAAAGALLGVRRVPAAFLYTAIAGGVLALVVIVARRQKVSVRGLDPRVAATKGRDAFFPYGPAIAFGCLVAALGF